MDSSRLSNERLLISCPSCRLRSYIRPVSGGIRLQANMDSRAPRANRGAGVKRQGCYRPDAVSVGPKGHESGHSLSISDGRAILFSRVVK
jgi:hypothetical protein